MERPVKQYSLLSVVLVVFLLWLLPFAAWADTKVIIAEGSYTMGDGETPNVAEARALNNAKQIAVEQAGTYLQSYTKTKNFRLTADEVQTIAGAIIEVHILEKNRMLVGQSFVFHVRIKATVTTDQLADLMSRLNQKDGQGVADLLLQYRELQDNYDRVIREIDSLKGQVGKAQSKQEREKTSAEIAKKERRFLATSLDDKGIESLFQKRDDAKALDYFSQALIQDPTYAQAYFHRALVMRREPSRIEQVISDITEAIRLNPHPAYYSLRAKVYLGQGRKEQALDDFAAAVRVSQGKKEAPYYYRDRGEAYKELGQYELAIADFTETLRILPLDDPVISWLGMSVLSDRAYALSQLARYREAIADYSEVIRLDPDPDPSLYNLRGILYEETGQHKSAIEDLTEALRLEPKGKDLERSGLLAGVHLFRAQAAFHLELMEQTINDSTEALRLDPKLAAGYVIRGKAKAFLGQYDTAINDLNEALRLKPSESNYYAVRAQLYGLQKRDQQALADLTAAIRLASDGVYLSEYYQMRGGLHSKLNQNEQALSDLSDSIRTNPKNAKSYMYRGAIYGILGKDHRAKNDFNKACELGEGKACDLLDKFQ